MENNRQWMYLQIELEPQPGQAALSMLDDFMSNAGYTKCFPDTQILSDTKLPRGTYAKTVDSENPAAQASANAIYDGVKALKLCTFVKVLALVTTGGAMIHN